MQKKNKYYTKRVPRPHYSLSTCSFNQESQNYRNSEKLEAPSRLLRSVNCKLWNYIMVVFVCVFLLFPHWPQLKTWVKIFLSLCIISGSKFQQIRSIVIVCILEGILYGIIWRLYILSVSYFEYASQSFNLLWNALLSRRSTYISRFPFSFLTYKTKNTIYLKTKIIQGTEYKLSPKQISSTPACI